MRSMTDAVSWATKLVRNVGFAKPGESLVVVAGVPIGLAGTTNALRVAVVK
jgi:pyruvate kinase